MSELTPIPIVQLNNGLRVANFSSHHSFEFEDGSKLGACSPTRTESLKMNREDNAIPCDDTPEHVTEVLFNCRMQDFVTDSVMDELQRLEVDDQIDRVIVPRVLLDALKLAGVRFRKPCTGRLVDRVDKIHSCTHFCR
jgi:hypothetical protein